MWKRDEAVRPAAEAATTTPTALRATELTSSVATIGKSVVIKGELLGSEDLAIEGQVEGKIELRDHVLMIGSNGKVRAQVFGKAVIVIGDVSGNITASDKVVIKEKGSVNGDLTAPRVAIAEGARFRGSIDMQRKHPSATSAAARTSTVVQSGSTGQHERSHQETRVAEPKDAVAGQAVHARRLGVEGA